MFIVAILVTIAGTFVPLSPQMAQQLSDELNQTVGSLNQTGGLTQFIFGNNFMICLLMFIPVVGPLFGLFVLFSTGTVLSAVSATQGFPAILAFIALMITPIFWLEFSSYSIAMAESIWLIRRITQRQFWRELKNAGLLVTLCAALLLIGAVIETALLALT